MEHRYKQESVCALAAGNACIPSQSDEIGGDDIILTFIFTALFADEAMGGLSFILAILSGLFARWLETISALWAR